MSNSTHFGLFGAGGFGREVMPWAVDSIEDFVEIPFFSYFIVDAPLSESVNEIEILTLESFTALEGSTKYFNVAVADSIARERIASELMDSGLKPINLHSRSATIQTSSTIAEGAIICPNSIITANTEIGRFFHANVLSYVGHDCVIGNYVTLAPSVTCAGNVVIEDHAYVGAGALIRQGAPGKPLTIGRGAVVGMGAVVTKDVAPYTTVVGNPARPM